MKINLILMIKRQPKSSLEKIRVQTHSKILTLLLIPLKLKNKTHRFNHNSKKLKDKLIKSVDMIQMDTLSFLVKIMLQDLILMVQLTIGLKDKVNGFVKMN